MLSYRYNAYAPGIKKPLVEMALNGIGIRDTARVLNISKGTVSSTLKKASVLEQVNPVFQPTSPLDSDLVVSLGCVCEEAELDEQWVLCGQKVEPTLVVVCG